MRYKEIDGYIIYEDGSIKGLHNRFIKPIIKDKGRREIRLIINGKRKYFIVARLVYWVFKDFNIEDKNLCVIHKDGDYSNCHINNLELVHRKDLIQGEKHIQQAKLTDSQVAEIRSLYKGKAGNSQHDKVGYSLQDLAAKYGVSKGNIALIIRKESRHEDTYKLK